MWSMGIPKKNVGKAYQVGFKPRPFALSLSCADNKKSLKYGDQGVMLKSPATIVLVLFLSVTTLSASFCMCLLRR